MVKVPNRYRRHSGSKHSERTSGVPASERPKSFSIFLVLNQLQGQQRQVVPQQKTRVSYL